MWIVFSGVLHSDCAYRVRKMINPNTKGPFSWCWKGWLGCTNSNNVFSYFTSFVGIKTTKQQQQKDSFKASFGCLASLHLLRLGVHTRLPGIPGHLRHWEDEEGNAAQKEKDKARASAGKGPGVVVLDPNRIFALNHAFHWLTHHLQRDESTDTWRTRSLCELIISDRFHFFFRSSNYRRMCRLTEPTCKCVEHSCRFEKVVSSFAFPSAWSQQTQTSKDHKGQTENGDGCSGNVVLWKIVGTKM